MKIEKRYQYILLGFLINICLGAIYSWSAFRKPLEEAMGISSLQSGLPFSVFLSFFAFSMPFTGRLIAKWGAKKCIMLGGTLVGLGWCISGYVHTIEVMILSYGVLGGLGVGMTYGVPLAVTSAWFPDKKGLALGLTIGGYGISTLFMSPIASWLISHYSVFGAFEILGIAFVVILLLLTLPMRLPHKEELAAFTDLKQTFNPETQYTPKKMLGTRRFYALWVAYMLMMFMGLGVISFSKSAGKEVFELSDSMATMALSFFAIFNGIGRPIFGSLSDNKGVRFSAILTFCLVIAAGIIVLFLKNMPLAYYLSFPLVWLCLGGWMSIAPIATIQFFGIQHYSKNYGIVFTAYGVGAIAGTLISGSMKDILNEYTMFFYPCTALSLIGIALVWFFLKEVKST